jgi:hypothetical protein
MSEEAQQALIAECERQRETCEYTATTFTIWLRCLKTLKTIFVVAPVVFGALATWKIVEEGAPVWASVFTILATAIPPAYRALGIDKAIDDYTRMSAEFTNLRDRFRQAASIESLKSVVEFDKVTKSLFDRLDKAREKSLTPPNWLFNAARRKVKAGDYRHDFDENRSRKA